MKNPVHLAGAAAWLMIHGLQDTRAWEGCFEMGNGAEVGAEYLKIIREDRELARCVIADTGRRNPEELAAARETLARANP